ncbi:hypothetical protein FQZ97_988630 [compost metagenome]
MQGAKAWAWRRVNFMAWDGRGWSIAMDLSCIYGERREALLGSQAGCGNASNLGPIVKAAAAAFN